MSMNGLPGDRGPPPIRLRGAAECRLAWRSVLGSRATVSQRSRRTLEAEIVDPVPSSSPGNKEQSAPAPT